MFPRTLLLAAALLFASCDNSSTSPNPDNSGVTGLSGTILHDNGKPFVNLDVRLKSTGVNTRTDANGRWSLPAPKAVAARSAAGSDSVIVSNDSQTIVTTPVTNYYAELPPLYIVQRDLYGSLANFVQGKYVVTAYLVLPDSTTRTIPLWHNQVAHAFSGFIYTIYTTQTVNYSVRVVVRDTTNHDDSTITGISPVVPFNSTAGDVTIPVFSYRNLVPSAKVEVEGAIRIGNEVKLTATVGDTDIVGGYMVSDNAKNAIYWKHGSANGNAAWTLGTKSLSVKIDTSVLRDSCYSVKVIDDQDSAVTTSTYCFDVPEDIRSTSAYSDTRSVKFFRFDSYDSTVSDTVTSVTPVLDSIKSGNSYVARGRIKTGDTLDLSVPDKINSIIARVSYYSWVDSNGTLVKRNVVRFDTTMTNKKALAYVRIDSTGMSSASVVKVVIWSEKPAVIAFFGDTLKLNAGDNKLIAAKKIADTASIALRLLPNVTKYLESARYKDRAYYFKYGNYLYGKYTLADLPGTYANGLLKLDNTNANDGKFVIKSIVGYK